MTASSNAAAYALRSAAHVVGVRGRAVFQGIWPPVAAAGVTSSAIAILEHVVLHASNRGTTPGFALLALELILGAVGYLGIMAVLRRKMFAEAVHSIRLALPAGRVSAAHTTASDRAARVDPSDQR